MLVKVVVVVVVVVAAVVVVVVEVVVEEEKEQQEAKQWPQTLRGRRDTVSSPPCPQHVLNERCNTPKALLTKD